MPETTPLLPPDVAELLLDGEPVAHPLAPLLAAARRPGTARELAGEAAARRAFADASPIATPVALHDPTRPGRHRRARLRTMVTAKLVGVAALTLTAGGVAVAATGPSGGWAGDDDAYAAAPADAPPSPQAAGRPPAAGHGGPTVTDTACRPVTGAAIAELGPGCADPSVGDDHDGPGDAGDDGVDSPGIDLRAWTPERAGGVPPAAARPGTPGTPPSTAPPATRPPSTPPPSTTAPPTPPTSTDPSAPTPRSGSGTSGGRGNGNGNGNGKSKPEGAQSSTGGAGATSDNRTTSSRPAGAPHNAPAAPATGQQAQHSP